MSEDKAYIILTGYFDVAAASDILNMYRIYNRIVKAPITLRKSCSYAVMVDKEEEEMSRYILQRKGIKLI